jgi:hypothetical protein
MSCYKLCDLRRCLECQNWFADLDNQEEGPGYLRNAGPFVQHSKQLWHCYESLGRNVEGAMALAEVYDVPDVTPLLK